MPVKSKLEKETKKTLKLVRILEIFPILIGLTISQIWKGEIDVRTMAPFVGGGYLLLALFLWKREKTKQENRYP